MGLQVNVPGVVRRRYIRNWDRVLRVADVDNTKALREHVPDVGMALVNHELHPIRSPTLVTMGDDLHVPGMIGLRQFSSGHERFSWLDPIQVSPPAPVVTQ